VINVRAYLRRRLEQPMVRPLALAGPIVVLLFALPLLRPLRHPSQVSDDERLRLATIYAIVERGTPALDPAQARAPHEPGAVVTRDGRHYAAQPPMMAVLLSAPAWAMSRGGLSPEGNLVPYILTLLGTTLPVAVAAGLIYRMGRLFELRRPWRTALGIAVVFASGLISYAVVLNPHAPAAALVLGSASCLVYAASRDRAQLRWTWFVVAGAASGLAATLDPAAAVLLVLFTFVIAAMRFRVGYRALGVMLYAVGAAIPVAAHARWNRPITGDWLPAPVHQLAAAARGVRAAQQAPPPFDDEDADAHDSSLLRAVWRPLKWVTLALVGGHGIVSHFPVLVIGVAGVFAVMHRHWPNSTKALAGATLVGSAAIVFGYGRWRVDWRDAMFASRWFVVFLPMLLFWMGAWVRRQHKPAAWVLAGVLFGFSVLVGIVGATGPWPTDGFRGYTALDATRRLLNPPPNGAPTDPPIETADTQP
jgi:hypothetical protein